MPDILVFRNHLSFTTEASSDLAQMIHNLQDLSVRRLLSCSEVAISFEIEIWQFES